jgi:hypothetical protein
MQLGGKTGFVLCDFTVQHKSTSFLHSMEMCCIQKENIPVDLVRSWIISYVCQGIIYFSLYIYDTWTLNPILHRYAVLFVTSLYFCHRNIPQAGEDKIMPLSRVLFRVWKGFSCRCICFLRLIQGISSKYKNATSNFVSPTIYLWQNTQRY